MNASQARHVATRWLEAWTSHDLDRILAFYADDAVACSPVAERLLGTPGGVVRGRAALREFFRRGLEAFPFLSFQLIETTWGMDSLVVYYVNHKGTRTCEYLELDAAGRIVRDVAHYAE